MISVPSQAHIDQSSRAFDKDWGAVDEVLYRLCREHPLHADPRWATAKVALIGRAYSAGLERRVTPPKGQQSISVIARYFEDHAAQIDEVLGGLASVQEPLSAESMVRIVQVHGRFVTLLVDMTSDGKSPRSFAAKYLHFHNPVVPVYDSYALAAIIRLVPWDAADIPFPCPPGGDAAPDGYYQFCVRFLRLYEACRRAGRGVTAKTLDCYLWAVPS
jgi:hypothetical protein